MEQKDNIIEFPIKQEITEETSKNPIVDTFEALSETLNLKEAENDITTLFGALLSMPDNDFKPLSTVLLDEINRSLNNPSDRLTLIAAMSAQGYKGEDLAETFDEICKEIDNQLTELSQIKKDWLK